MSWQMVAQARPAKSFRTVDSVCHSEAMIVWSPGYGRPRLLKSILQDNKNVPMSEKMCPMHLVEWSSISQKLQDLWGKGLLAGHLCHAHQAIVE